MRTAKDILLLIACVLGGLTCVSAQESDVPKMREIKGKKLSEEIHPLQHKKGLWGYANSEDEYIIKPVFTAAYDFEGNLARVLAEDKWGVIGSNGLYICTPKYDYISEFSADSVAIVALNNIYGLIDNMGKSRVVQSYQGIERRDYGYLVKSAGKYGTLDGLGNPILPPQFDDVKSLNDGSPVEMFLKDDKWGVVRDGSEILAHKWDKPLEPFKAGKELSSVVYLAQQGTKVGVVTSFGDYVVPCYYDSIELDASGLYFVTRRGDKYGALTLELDRIMAPVLAERPVLTESLFRIYDGYEFFAGNAYGAVNFRYCPGLYQAYKPEQYATTTDIPKWSKEAIIEENISNLEDMIEDSRVVLDLMVKHNFNDVLASMDSEMPKGIPLRFAASETQKYGITNRGTFTKTSDGYVTVRGRSFRPYYTSKRTDDNIAFLYDNFENEYFISVNNRLFAIKDIFAKYKVKVGNGFYPVEYLSLPNGLAVIHLAFVRSASEVGTSLFETDPNMLASDLANIKFFTGDSKSDNETHAIIVLNTRTLSANQFVQLAKGSGYRLIGTTSGAFYVGSSSTLLADVKTPLKRYDKDGMIDWEFRPASNEKFYDIEETENYVYLCGSKLNSGTEKPLVLQLTKGGLRVDEYMGEGANGYFSNMKCSGYILYTRTAPVKGDGDGRDYYPFQVLADMNDDIGINLHCVWEDWGGAQLGGCGLTDMDGRWVQSPILDSEGMCTSYGWEFGAFTGNILIVRHLTKYGAVNRNGQMVVDTKYDEVKELANRDFVRATLNNRSCVYDVDGRVIVPADYDYVGLMHEDMIIVSKDGLYGCYDKNGNMVVPLAYDEIREFADGVAAFRLGDKYGFIDTRGEILIEPFADDVGDFSEGLAWAMVSGNVGYISKTGEWVVPSNYAEGGLYVCGLAPAKDKDKGSYGFVSGNGSLKIPAKYQAVQTFSSEFKIARVSIGSKWGVIGTDGKNILPIRYDVVEIFPDGYIVVKQDEKYGIFTCTGETVFPISCSSIVYKRGENLFTHGSVSARSDQMKAITIDEFGNSITKFTQAIKRQ